MNKLIENARCFLEMAKTLNPRKYSKDDEARLKKAMDERQNRIKFKQADTIVGMEVSDLGFRLARNAEEAEQHLAQYIACAHVDKSKRFNLGEDSRLDDEGEQLEHEVSRLSNELATSQSEQHNLKQALELECVKSTQLEHELQKTKSLLAAKEKELEMVLDAATSPEASKQLQITLDEAVDGLEKASKDVLAFILETNRVHSLSESLAASSLMMNCAMQTFAEHIASVRDGIKNGSSAK